MKKLFKTFLKGMADDRRQLPTALLCGVVMLGCSITPVRAQVSPVNTYVLTNVPATIATGAGVFLTNSALQPQVIPLTRNCCLSLGGRANASAASGAEVLGGSFTIDGTNFGVSPFVVSNTLAAGNPTNAIGQPIFTSFTNFTQAQLSGFTGVTFTSMTNTSSGTASNITWVVNRPTLNVNTY